MKKIFNVNYKTLALIPLFGLSLHSCKETKGHQNIVIGSWANQLLIQDTKTNEERVIQCEAHSPLVKDLKFFQAGDTVYVSTSYNYETYKICEPQYTTIRYNQDSINERKARMAIFDLKQAILNNKNVR